MPWGTNWGRCTEIKSNHRLQPQVPGSQIIGKTKTTACEKWVGPRVEIWPFREYTRSWYTRTKNRLPHLASTQAPTRFLRAVFFAFPTIWEPGTGYTGWFFRRGENLRAQRKTSQRRVKKQQSQPPYDTESRNALNTAISLRWPTWPSPSHLQSILCVGYIERFSIECQK